MMNMSVLQYSKEITDFLLHELDDHFGMGINLIPMSSKKSILKSMKHNDFSELLSNWYSNYKQEFER